MMQEGSSRGREAAGLSTNESSEKKQFLFDNFHNKNYIIRVLCFVGKSGKIVLFFVYCMCGTFLKLHMGIKQSVIESMEKPVEYMKENNMIENEGDIQSLIIDIE